MSPRPSIFVPLLVWAMVAVLIIAIIVNIVSSYANFIQDLANPNAR